MVQRAIAAAAGAVEQLAAEVGVSYGTMWAWANGKRNPSPENVSALAKVLRKRGRVLAKLADQLEDTR